MTSLRSITEAEKSIAAGERKIAAQKRLIETLERDGLLAQMGAAQEILRSLEDAQERLLAVHARLIAERNR